MITPEVSIIIVHWNTTKLLRACLTSLLQQQGVSYEVIVIDNNSTEKDALRTPIEFPTITWIQNQKNVGFAAANNQGMRIAKGEHILLLNPDTELQGKNSLQTLVQERALHNAGIIGPKLVFPGNQLQPSVRDLPTVKSLFFLLSKLHLLFPMSVTQLLQKDFSYLTPASVGQVSGACFLISSECKKAVGLLDEGFWIWFEEVDYCFRARKAGFTIWYTPKVTCVHVGGSSFGQVIPFRRQWEFTKSALRYAHKHFSIFGTIACALVSPLGLCVAFLTPRKLRQLSYKQ